METQFLCMTRSDLDLAAEPYSVFHPRLMTLAYQKLLECFKAGLSSFPLYSAKDEANNAHRVQDNASDSEQYDFSDEGSDSDYDFSDEDSEPEVPQWSDQDNKPKTLYHEPQEVSEFIENARTVLGALPGQLGDDVRSKMFADLESFFYYRDEIVAIKNSVLLSIFGHENLTSLSIKIEQIYFLLPEYKIFDTIASKWPNLKELSINIESIAKRYDCEQAYYWKLLEKLTSLESLTIIGGKLPSDLNLGQKLKTLKFLNIKKKKFSSYKLCAAMLRPEFKNVAEMLVSWSNSVDNNSRMNSSAVEELLQCAGNEACLQPFCRTLTTLSLDKKLSTWFWRPASAAFLLLACPNLKNFYTTDTFPYYQALRLLNKCLDASPKTFNLGQLYVIPEYNENIQEMMQSTPHCQELVIQGVRVHDEPEHSLDVELWLVQLMKAVGNKASTLSVTYRYPYEMTADQLEALSMVREMRWAVSPLCLDERKSCKRARCMRPLKLPILKNLKKLILSGCCESASEAPLLKECTDVEELYFQCIHFCLSGKELVKFARRHWSSLRVLHTKSLEQVNLDSEGIIELLKVCPKLKLLVLPHSVLRTFEKEPFAKLHAFAEERGTQIRFAAPEKRKLYCNAYI